MNSNQIEEPCNRKLYLEREHYCTYIVMFLMVIFYNNVVYKNTTELT
jgi:hypothetical protein